MFLIPGLVIVMYITKSAFPAGYKAALINYLKTRANKQDGGWGIHTEGISTVFGTSLNYVALRLLGVPANDPACQKARNTLWKLGGAVGCPSWGKFWLSVLGVYDWEGNQPIPPELWILPSFLPIHPSNMWCHTRAVYLPMCYLYAKRFQCPDDDLIMDLREELYPVPYDSIDWVSQRNNVASSDLYCETSSILSLGNMVLDLYEHLPGKASVRSLAIKEVLRQIRMEDENTDYLDIGPVNKVMIMLIVWLEDGCGSASFSKHLERVKDFMWMSNGGMMMNGTNGSQLWDTSFAVQALMAGNLWKNDEKVGSMLQKALAFIETSQVTEIGAACENNFLTRLLTSAILLLDEK